ncbi:gamma-glutamyltransferase family protein [Rhizobium lusitanum]|uniref:gamma-glutamyltransferase family protein n=1 Tax=Rhizobium lusitanum TaxID=293958 RepID=UPI001957A63D|nr:gamma-glutamyltransferase family protein [Rhizobium lusitanum]MBM7049230.1 gamma-glutamyltransferase family protein [Rhizobium lusitanum]
MTITSDVRSSRAFRNRETASSPFTTVVRGRQLAVAAHNHLSAQVGLAMLREGGNAIDAAVAAVLVEGIVDPHMHTMGGECPILIHKADGNVIAINGNTAAPRRATVAAFRERGLSDVPDEGVLASGVPATLGSLLAALTQAGRLPFSAVAAPAIDIARNGFAAHRGLLQQEGFGIDALAPKFNDQWPGSAAIYCPNGRPPQEGQILRNPAFADLLEYLCKSEQSVTQSRIAGLEAVRAAFYQGDAAQAIGDFVRERNGLLEALDLAAYTTNLERPVHLDLGRHRIFKCGPWNQGPAMLHALQLYPGPELARLAANGIDAHRMVEAVKLAYSDRDQFYGDPNMIDVPIDTLLSEEYADLRRTLIDDRRANPDMRPGDPLRMRALLDPEAVLATRNWGPGTVHVAATDSEGNMIAATPSGGWLKSNEVVPRLGFPLGNRLMTFYLAPDHHPNVIAPEKRPRTTISPTMVLKDGRPFMAFGSMGGDQQDQWQMQFLVNRLLLGMGLAEAIDAPRWSSESFPGFFAPHNRFPNRLRLEERLAVTHGTDLTARGHEVIVGPDWTEGFIVAAEFHSETSSVSAAVDPRGTKSGIFSSSALAC